MSSCELAYPFPFAVLFVKNQAYIFQSHLTILLSDCASPLTVSVVLSVYFQRVRGAKAAHSHHSSATVHVILTLSPRYYSFPGFELSLIQEELEALSFDLVLLIAGHHAALFVILFSVVIHLVAVSVVLEVDLAEYSFVSDPQVKISDPYISKIKELC